MCLLTNVDLQGQAESRRTERTRLELWGEQHSSFRFLDLLCRANILFLCLRLLLQLNQVEVKIKTGRLYSYLIFRPKNEIKRNSKEMCLVGKGGSPLGTGASTNYYYK